MSTPEEFVRAFANAIVKRDFTTAEAMLAPWLRAELPDGALKKVLRRARGEGPPPFDADVASLPHNTPASLRESFAEHAAENGPLTLATYDSSGAMFGPPSFPIAAEITEANFRGVWRIEFVPDPELESGLDYSYALFLVVVVRDAGFAVGYLEPAD